MEFPKRIIKAGETDRTIVKAIQQRLLALGIGDFEATGTFGPKTTAAVKQFQALHRDRFGNPLITDGKIGSITWEILFDNVAPVQNVAPTGLLAKAIEVAESQIGVMEKPPGSNRGAEVDAYLRSTNTPLGSFWCAAFIYWCFNEAAGTLSIVNPVVKTAGCLAHWNKTQATKITKAQAINDPMLIKPGSIFIKDHGGGLGHTGIVTAVSDGFIETIEGNSNPSGSSNGIGVFRLKFRKINAIEKGFIIYE
ncbi:CHAP domain-containing protein [Chitinophaga sp. SYP-B3965]|uniref:CHAP domain-containing protein n=1 Tax=Chitinophaga sp. SYP-B3965 TaxID=2663120 RepID=UPI001299CAFF|nr:CHAP domain-containing protein [Chitinophaga sp. SYP-B3965]MRG48781.1 CHAP domain-containing protein [Chitinophaga sp. SYP-B3965]